MNQIQAAFPDNLQFLYPILFFPIQLMEWVFMGEVDALFASKVLLLFLPVLLITVGFWTSLLCLSMSLFRSNRIQFIATVLITWWDGGRAILLYWAGLMRFIFLGFGWSFGALRISILALFQTIKDILFLPLTVLNQMASNYSKPGIPWIAVSITFLWIALESLIFSYVLTPMVSEILVAMTDFELARTFVTFFLFIFLFMVIGGSMACMHGLVEAIEQKSVLGIIKMLFIEIIVMLMEVVFFYREFVESVLPFFNRMSEDEIMLGPLAILGIGIVAWFGIRAGTWFFFARYGTPTLLMIISREGMDESQKKKDSIVSVGKPLSWIKHLTKDLQSEIDWFSLKGSEIIEAFVLPPI
ncbi:MAG: hypothetical protein HON90_09640, partial [Halobacteriovoraceae bacterium]|nr:hypothetical protein [Halobacteriovoraceae bacterium]